MKIEINNFGPIDNLTFDLDKDLHLIYGQNAIGKSYGTYCLYNLIKNINKIRFSSVLHGLDDVIFGRITNFLHPKLATLHENPHIDYRAEYFHLINNFLKDSLLEGFRNSLLNTFSSLTNLKNRYSNKSFSIKIEISETESLLIFLNKSNELDLEYKDNTDKLEIRHKATKTTKFSLYQNGVLILGKPNEKEFMDSFEKFFFYRLVEILNKLNTNVRDIYYLPASRSGLYQALNAFTPIIAELTQSRFFIQNKSIELPSLSEPLSDYFIDLSTIDKKHVNKEFKEIINILQHEILRGDVSYNDKTKKIIYRPQGIDLELNLSEASSMVAELSPLVLYFKHIINNKYSTSKSKRYFNMFFPQSPYALKESHDILFIEEPEAHLHPDVQVQLMKVFAMLSKLGLKVFITSHSNYMFNKLNNIIIKNEIDIEKVIVYHLVKGKNGTVKNTDMEVTEAGIDDENFQATTEELYNERLTFFEQAND